MYNDLPHPPSSQIGTKYAWRAADGANNNLSDPEMGKAGTPYARSVPSARPVPASALPDAGLVFDMLLKRDKFEPHPGALVPSLRGLPQLTCKRSGRVEPVLCVRGPRHPLDL